AWDGTFDTHTTLEQVFVAETSRLHIHVLQRLRNVRRAPLKGSNQRWHINAVLARPNVLKTECSISLNHSSRRRIRDADDVGLPHEADAQSALRIRVCCSAFNDHAPL